MDITDHTTTTNVITKPKSKVRMKRCAKCQNKKALEFFPKHSSSSDGHASYCASCRNNLHKERRKKDIVARLKHHIATRVAKQLANSDESKESLKTLTSNLETYLGYKLFKLKKRLAQQVKSEYGVSLREAFDLNYHVDHTKPLSLFNVTSLSCQEFKDCWQISNLRLIPAEENLTKGARYNES